LILLFNAQQHFRPPDKGVLPPEAVRSLCEDEEHLLTFYAFPQVMHRYIRTTNAIESFFSNVRQRTDQIDAFTTETSCLTIVWAVMPTNCATSC
jgi:transposase-like protein